jgi:hypothetical protein
MNKRFSFYSFTKLSILLTVFTLCVLQSDLVNASCQMPIRLQAEYSGSWIHLEWAPGWTQSEWRVEADQDIDFSNPVILAYTTIPEYDYSINGAQPAPVFFRIIATEHFTAADSLLVEDFEIRPALEGWADEDVDPDAWEFDDSQSWYHNSSLHLTGNTVKSQVIGGPELDLNSAFRVAARSSGVSDRQMVGFADSLNTLWYVIWGTRGGYPDTPGQSGQTEVSTYQGWFGQDEWVQMILPVGKDWQGKFDYMPELCHVIWANESDDDEGEVWFDALEEVSGIWSSRPTIDPQFEIIETSIDQQLVSFSDQTGETGLMRIWSFGNGVDYIGDATQVWLPSATNSQVVLYAENSLGAWSHASLTVPGSGDNRSISLGFAGDIMTARSYDSFIEDNGVEAIFDSIRTEFESVDLMMINQECPFTTSSDEHPTKGITFKVDPSHIAGIESAGVDFASMANNHTFDYMIEGMLETMQVLDEHNIYHTGCGIDSRNAMRPVFLSANGMSVGVIGFSDRTGNYNNYQPYLDAGADRPGFALWSRANMQLTLPDLSQDVDLLVVQVHSGNEYSYAPTFTGLREGDTVAEDEDFLYDPELRGIFSRDLNPDQSERSIRQEAIDLGADLVITHHPHIIQGLEVYNDGLIAHSLGNFVMDLSYIETMSTFMLKTFHDEEVLTSVEVLPAFLENDIPRYALGGLAEGIIDHITEMSLEFDTWVVRSEGSTTASVVMDTSSVTLETELFAANIDLVEDGAYWISAPIKLDEQGYLSLVRNTSMNTGLEIRNGSDILWWGNMEDEGAPIWDINSSLEWYSSAESYTGERSIQMQDNSGTVRTYFTGRAPLDPDFQYSLGGWIKHNNATSASIQMRYYTQRTNTNVIDPELAGGETSGTLDWHYMWANLDLPNEADFYQLRLELDSQAGGSDAWFDDVGLIRWNEWRDADPGVDVPYRFPNSGQWIQIRIPTASGSVSVEYEKTRVTSM